MLWKRYIDSRGIPSDTTIASDCGYCVLRAHADGVPTGRFLAFLGKTGDADFRVLGGYDSADDAKAACDAHFAKMQEVA